MRTTIHLLLTYLLSRCQPMANAEGVRTTLQIATLVPARLGVYRVSARNAVGASEESVRVLRRDHRSSDARRDSSAPVSGDRRPGYSHSHGNAPPGKPRIHRPPPLSPDGATRKRQHASDSSLLLVYRPRKDERLSWPSWLTCSGRFTHISGHPSAAGRAQPTGKVRQSETDVLPLCYATNCIRPTVL